MILLCDLSVCRKSKIDPTTRQNFNNDPNGKIEFVFLEPTNLIKPKNKFLFNYSLPIGKFELTENPKWPCLQDKHLTLKPMQCKHFFL